MSVPQDTYSLAHTAQCKLRLAANRPDRSLRLILGHAFTLDALTLRILQIEEGQQPDEVEQKGTNQDYTTGRHVSFSAASTRPSGEHRGQQSARGRQAVSPPPEPEAVHTGASAPDSISDEEEVSEDDDFDEEEDDSTPLTRFVSASAMPPRSIDDVKNGGNAFDEDPKVSSPPPTALDEAQLREIVNDEQDKVLASLYEGIRSCGCQKEYGKPEAPILSNIWKVPGPLTGQQGMPRLAVVRV